MTSIRKNYVYNVISQIVSILAPLVTTPYVSRVLGPAGVGRYSFTSSVVAYFLLFATLGTTTYGQREISYCQDDRKKRSRVFWEIELLSCMAVAASVIAFIVFLLIDGFEPIYVVQVFTLIAAAADISWLFTGMEEFRVTVIRNIFVRLANIAFIFIAVRDSGDLIVYVAGLCVFTLLGNMSLWPAARRLVGTVPLRGLRPLRHLRADIALFVPTVAISVYTVLDKTMINLITGSDAENGNYEQSQKVAKAALTFVTALTSVLASRIGAYYSDDDKESVREKMYKAYSFVWMLSLPLCFGLIGVADNLVPWFLGKGYEQSVNLVRISGLLIPAISLSNLTGLSYLVPTKRQNYLTASVTTGAAVNVILNSIMIPQLAAAGAAIASVAAETLITAIQLFIVRKELSLRQIFHSAIWPLIASVVMLFIVRLEGRRFTPSILHTCIMILTGVVIYAVSMIFVIYVPNRKKG